MTYRTTQCLEVADLICSGSSMNEALRRVIVTLNGTNAVRVTDVLADLQAMGVWTPRPNEAR